MNFGTDLAIGAAGSIASGLVNAGIDRLLNGSPQQQIERQLNANKQMMLFQNNLARSNFDYEYKKNSPAAQVKRLRDAGLNPNIMNGMSGTGMSATMASPSQASVSDGRLSAMTTLDPMSVSNVRLNNALAEKALADARRTTGQEDRDVDVFGLKKTAMELDNQLKSSQLEGSELGNALAALNLDVQTQVKEHTIENYRLKNEQLKGQISHVLQSVENLQKEGQLTEQQALLTYQQVLNAERDRMIMEIKARLLEKQIDLTDAQIHETLASAGLMGSQTTLVNAETLTEYAKSKGLRIENERAIKAAKYDGYNNCVNSIKNTTAVVGDLVDIGVSLFNPVKGIVGRGKKSYYER